MRKNNNQHVVLIAGGIGITPIKSMALALLKQQQSFELHYAGRSQSEMAYTDRLTRQLGNKLHLYPSQAGIKLSLKKLISQQIAQQNTQAHFYFCGPVSMLNELRQHALELNITSDRIHYELFSTEPTHSANACQLTLTQSNVKIEVASDQTLLDAVLDAGIEMPYSCKSGQCKSCVVEVSPDADIEHLDNCLTEQERTSGKMCLCVSRPQSQTLKIAL